MGVFDKRVAFKPFEYPEIIEYKNAINHSYWLHCVGPEDRVCTSEGLIRVIDLHKRFGELILFNNDKMIKSSPMMRTGHRKLFILHTKEGFSHSTTEDHRIMTPNGWVEVRNLKKDDLICIQTKKGLFGKVHAPEKAFLQGYFQGDGTRKPNAFVWQLWSHEYHLAEKIRGYLKIVYEENGLKGKVPSFCKEYFCNDSEVGTRQMWSQRVNDIFSEKGTVPEFVWNGDEETVWAYLQGLLFTDGSVGQNKKSQSISLGQSNLPFLKEVQKLLLNFGIKSSIITSGATKKLMPAGKKKYKEYNCKEKSILKIDRHKFLSEIEKNIGIFSHRGVQFRKEFNEKKSHPIIHARFSHLEFVGESDVFCVSVDTPDRAWICNGFITHNTEWNFIGDIHDFNVKLNSVEKSIIKNALLAISQIEVSVKKFWTKLGERFPKAEFEQVGVTFGESEVRHADAYSHLLEILGFNDEFALILQNPVIQGRVDYLTKYLKGASDNSNENYTLTLTLFSIFIENVSLFSQFLIIKSFSKYKNLLHSIDNVIQATIKEEMLHALFGIFLIKIIKEEYPEWFNEDFYEKLTRACKKAYEAECKIIDWIYESGGLEFLPKGTVKEFVKNRFNESLESIGGKSVFDINKEMTKGIKWFDDEIHAEVNTDFFYKKPVTYSKFAQAITEDTIF